MKIKIDLHMHTTASDGKLSPKDLVILASKQNLDIISITDHDTTAGIEEAMNASEPYNLKIIPGIELSTIHNNESIHILGYFKDDSYKNKEFQKFLKDMQDYRVYRAKKIVENLNTYFSIKLDYEKVFKKAKGVIARPHIASSIIEEGYPYSWDYIFNNIISKDSPAYVHNKKVSLSEGIKILKDLNALVILAHPVLIKKSKVEDLLKYDFDGIEALYFLNTNEDTLKFINLAEKYKKLVTFGSDFHGLGADDTKHGYIGSMDVPYEYADIFIKTL